ncbi:MAG: hypothetical protein HY231_19450 [Acidobacteria bacterium]|nr:hypothetical protein [Acidobacteriota bacterium]
MLSQLIWCVVLLLALLPISASARQEKKTAPQVIVKGRVACLDESGQRLNADQDDSPTSSVYELLTAAGQRFHFSSEDLLLPIFTEARVRQMELQITALLHEKSVLELEKVQAVKDGRLYDIYYFCRVCNITAYAPGPCPCCYARLEFMETPAP